MHPRFASVAPTIALCVGLLALGCASTDPSKSRDSEPPTHASEVEGPAPQSGESGLCSLGPRAEWATCEGQRVRMRGREAVAVMQHPVVAVPQPGASSHQGYIDVDDTQLIVLTKAPLDCGGGGELVVVGTLRSVDVDDDPEARGKNSYSGWSLEEAEVICE